MYLLFIFLLEYNIATAYTVNSFDAHQQFNEDGCLLVNQAASLLNLIKD